MTTANRFSLVFCNGQGNKKIIPYDSYSLRHFTSEARDLQRNLSKKQKDDHCYYAVFEDRSLIYSAYGY